MIWYRTEKYDKVICNVCGYEEDRERAETYNFCPMCGQESMSVENYELTPAQMAVLVNLVNGLKEKYTIEQIEEALKEVSNVD